MNAKEWFYSQSFHSHDTHTVAPPVEPNPADNCARCDTRGGKHVAGCLELSGTNTEVKK